MKFDKNLYNSMINEMKYKYILFMSGCNPMEVGEAGSGKTEMTKQFGKLIGKKVITLVLSQMEPSDFLGLPVPDLEKQRTVFLKPSWWPKEDETDEYIIFLDEFNRAHPMIHNAVMQLVLDKQIENHKLPEGTWICAAINPSNEDYNVMDVYDRALIDRFVWLKFDPDKKTWHKYLKDNGFHDVVSFMERHPEYEKKKNFQMPEMQPTNRTWVRMSKIKKFFFKEVVVDKNNLTHEEKNIFSYICRATLGQNAGLAYFDDVLNAKDISHYIPKILNNEIDEKEMKKLTANNCKEIHMMLVNELETYEIDETVLSGIHNYMKNIKGEYCYDLTQLIGKYLSHEDIVLREKFTNIFMLHKPITDLVIHIKGLYNKIGR